MTTDQYQCREARRLAEEWRRAAQEPDLHKLAVEKRMEEAR